MEENSSIFSNEIRRSNLVSFNMSLFRSQDNRTLQESIGIKSTCICVVESFNFAIYHSTLDSVVIYNYSAIIYSRHIQMHSQWKQYHLYIPSYRHTDFILWNTHNKNLVITVKMLIHISRDKNIGRIYFFYSQNRKLFIVYFLLHLQTETIFLRFSTFFICTFNAFSSFIRW